LYILSRTYNDLTFKHARVTKLCEERQTLLKYTTDVRSYGKRCMLIFNMLKIYQWLFVFNNIDKICIKKSISSNYRRIL